ncbi:cryptococcal mannosyltransferase 1-domain-containing protein [Dactylonectria estremocensis]|uniref:Cryptococcal mannosyltransferase 1-domain-containing protein n=1 Tax=Dactylonectria estremocensis TaxID=1079267 RepID=A0A9P9I628_9HYPO|nr:cryptococcal mannosyltransferase 1-domain-containing protein [Dactylonectria estremocensis]
MRRRSLILLVPATCLLLIAMAFYLGQNRLELLPALDLPYLHSATSSTSVGADAKQTVATPTSWAATSATTSQNNGMISNGSILPASKITAYLTAILDPTATEPPRLECPSLNISRYEPLLQQHQGPSHFDYYFALDLRNCLPLLPRLLGSIIETIRFLGPERCVLSVIEGNSPDGTADVLVSLRPLLDDINLAYYFNSSDINPAKGNRIHKLAELRNQALNPILSNLDQVSENTTIIFLNDVAACSEDILELALQRNTLGADMTCAMDWTYAGMDPTFYDVWVARTLGGDSFFDIPSDGNWNSAWNLFWNAPDTRVRYEAKLPFQVFSCWNGAAAIGAAPLLGGLRFRETHGGQDGECVQGEPQIFCKEMWFRGYRKIAVVPTVNLEYSDANAQKIKRLKGFTSDLVRKQRESDARINWVLEPPPKVKCMPTWDNQFWRPWNESLLS